MVIKSNLNINILITLLPNNPIPKLLSKQAYPTKNGFTYDWWHRIDSWPNRSGYH